MRPDNEQSKPTGPASSGSDSSSPTELEPQLGVQNSTEQTQTPEEESEPVSDEELDQMSEFLTDLANTWRKRLKDPLLRNMVKRGLVKIDPLVMSLIRAQDQRAQQQASNQQPK
jgi:hypothetical protein